MTDSVAVFGDGVVTIPESIVEELNMSGSIPVDLPPNVAAELQVTGMQGFKAQIEQIRGVGLMATGVLQASMARNFDKVGTEEARALSGLNSTPLGAPSGNKAQA